MDVDPMEAVGDDKDTSDKRKNRLNSHVAVTVALLATFLGICSVKDDNIVQAMQQAQADKIDDFAWYQARNIREEVARATAATLEAQSEGANAARRAALAPRIAAYQRLAEEQAEKKKQQEADAKKADATYNALNFHDDQFDLCNALSAIAISLLAVTALTQKRWLYVVALVPAFFAVLFGLAGLLGWRLHPDALTRMLS